MTGRLKISVADRRRSAPVALGIGALLLVLGACASGSDQSGVAAAGQADMASSDRAAVPDRGLPSSPRPGTEEDFLVAVQNRVFFDTDRHDLNAEAREVLARQAAWLKRYGNIAVLIEGHADERGTREYNLALGARRAASVKDYLISLGISPNRLRTISYGKDKPMAPGSNTAAWRLNRRSVTLLENAPTS